MSGLAQTAQRCNQLCDVHSERYLSTAAGKFPPEVVQESIKKVSEQGFVIRLKSESELSDELAAYDLAQRILSKPVLRTSYTDQRRRELLEEVNALMHSGHFAAEACKIAKVEYSNYLRWRSRYGGQLPALQRVGRKKGDHERV